MILSMKKSLTWTNRTMDIKEYVQKKKFASFYRMSDPQPNWEQDDPSQPNYIKGKPDLGGLAEKDKVGISELSPEVIEYLKGNPIYVLATEYKITIPNNSELWECVDEQYQMIKVAQNIGETDSVIPYLENGEMWTEYGFDIILLDGGLVICVDKIPAEESKLTILVLKSSDGGEL